MVSRLGDLEVTCGLAKVEAELEKCAQDAGSILAFVIAKVQPSLPLARTFGDESLPELLQYLHKGWRK